MLKPFRQQASADIASRVDRRVDRKRHEGGDEAAEDAEVARPDRRASDSDSDFR